MHYYISGKEKKKDRRKTAEVYPIKLVKDTISANELRPK